MKKIFILIAVLALSLGFFSKANAEDRDCSQDDLYDRQQSLVIYHFKGSDGEDQRITVGQRSDLPSELQGKCWECWVDAFEWFNCQEK